MESENLSSLLKQTLWNTARPGQICYHLTSFSSKNAMGFVISHPFLLFVLWQTSYKKKQELLQNNEEETNPTSGGAIRACEILCWLLFAHVWAQFIMGSIVVVFS